MIECGHPMLPWALWASDHWVVGTENESKAFKLYARTRAVVLFDRVLNSELRRTEQANASIRAYQKESRA